VCKPDSGIFRFDEKKLGINPAETLFMDDSAANCEAARALGFHAAQVLPGTEFITLIPSEI
ncbi:MAG: HAD-IA family hydrolase, partial [Candidatus Amulumruptor sp.]